MNKKTLFSFLAIALFTTFSFAQNRALPNKDVKTLDGSKFNITNLENDGNPIVISFPRPELAPVTIAIFPF